MVLEDSMAGKHRPSKGYGTLDLDTKLMIAMGPFINSSPTFFGNVFGGGNERQLSPIFWTYSLFRPMLVTSSPKHRSVPKIWIIVVGYPPLIWA